MRDTRQNQYLDRESDSTVLTATIFCRVDRDLGDEEQLQD